MRSLLLAGAGRLAAGSVLGLHAVDTVEAPCGDVSAVTRQQLAALLEAARRVTTIVPLVDFVQRYRSGRSMRGLLAITFDDAYASLWTIRDLFTTEHIPFTVFPVTSALDDGAAFWWDRLDHIAARADEAVWHLLEGAAGLEEPQADTSPQSRAERVRRMILRVSRGIATPAVRDALTRSESQIGSSTEQRSMTWSELRSFCEPEGISVGVHTQHHGVLPLHDPPVQIREIGGAYERLEARLPGVVPILAVPYGIFNADTPRIAESAGMHATLSLANRTTRWMPRDAEIPRFCLTRHETPMKLTLRVTGTMDGINLMRGILERYPEIPRREDGMSA